MSARLLGRTFLGLVLMSALAGGGNAHAAFPVFNGPVAFTNQVVDGDSYDYEIYLVDPDGDNLRKLFTDPDHADTGPTWSPDGQRIAYTSTRPEFRPQLYVMQIGALYGTRVSFDDGYDGDPTWSPEGDRLAFSYTPVEGESDIWTLNLQDSTRTRLTTAGGEDPAWSPKGGLIAFTRFVGDEPEIFIKNLATGFEQNATNHPARDVQPAWSPDGTKIAFASNRGGGNELAFEIFVLDIFTATVTQVTSGEGLLNHSPAWSPDGTKIAFSSSRHGSPEDVFIMDADGTDVVQVTDLPGITQDLSWGVGPPTLVPLIKCAQQHTERAVERIGSFLPFRGPLVPIEPIFETTERLVEPIESLIDPIWTSVKNGLGQDPLPSSELPPCP